MIQIGDGAYNTEKLIGFAPSGTIGYATVMNCLAATISSPIRRSEYEARNLVIIPEKGDFFLNGSKKGLSGNSSNTLSIPVSGSTIMLAKGQHGN